MSKSRLEPPRADPSRRRFDKLSGSSGRTENLEALETRMVDNFAILLTHGLLALALWRLLDRADLDHEVSERERWQQAQDGSRDA